MRIGKTLDRVAAAVVLVATIGSLSGCRFISWFRNSGSDLPVTAMTQMPRVTFTDLDKTGRKLTSAGLNVVVRREELSVTPEGQGVDPPFSYPAVSRLFKAGEWNHMIEAQDPPAGATLRVGETVTLTAGMHHGAGFFRPWLDAHPVSVKIRGEQRCRDCHAPGRCSECHAKAGVTAKP